MNKIMKIFVLVFMQFLLSASLFAQKDVTQFLGIPVDGYKPEMIKKLKDKGFVISPFDKDVLTGEFNGTTVNIGIVTNNNKVCRIWVADANSQNEADIKIRFDKLLQQFLNNKRYLTASSDSTISESENISYELTVNKKRYEANFYQLPADLDTMLVSNEIRGILMAKYTENQRSNPTEEELKDMTMTVISYLLDKYSKEVVWFMISENYGKYYITMFYDNEYNRANGEDL